MVHIGFLINIPAKGNTGAKEALRYWNALGLFVPEAVAEQTALGLSARQCYAKASVTCADGTEITVHILGVPATSGALLDQEHPLHRVAVERLLAAPEKIRKLAKTDLAVLGLGAATAIAAGHGRQLHNRATSLQHPIGIVTAGNTITAGLSVEIAAAALTERGVHYPVTLGVLGGFGSTGSRVVTLATEQFRPTSVVVTGRPGRDHSRGIEELQQRFPETKFSLGTLKEAVATTVAFLATSSVEALPIEPDWIAHNAILVDIGKPLNTEPSLCYARPDVTILDGSLAQLPHGNDWRDLCRRMKLPPNTVFGCLAETIYLGWKVATDATMRRYFGQTTFIGRPESAVAQAMMAELPRVGLRPALHRAHQSI